MYKPGDLVTTGVTHIFESIDLMNKIVKGSICYNGIPIMTLIANFKEEESYEVESGSLNKINGLIPGLTEEDYIEAFLSVAVAFIKLDISDPKYFEQS
jgi:hypothetical protein